MKNFKVTGDLYTKAAFSCYKPRVLCDDIYIYNRFVERNENVNTIISLSFKDANANVEFMEVIQE